MTTSPDTPLTLWAPEEEPRASDDLDATLEYLVGQVYWLLVLPQDDDEHTARLLIGRLNGRIFCMMNDLFPHPPAAPKLVCVR
jgi:hypothetical protein